MVLANCVTLGNVRDLRQGEQLHIFNADRNWLDTGIFDVEFDEETQPFPALGARRIFNHIKGKSDTYTHSQDYKGSVYWWWECPYRMHDPWEFEWEINYRPHNWFPLRDGKLPTKWMIEEGITPPEVVDARDYPDSTPCGWRGPSVEIYKMLELLRERASTDQPQQQLFRSKVSHTRRKIPRVTIDYRYEVLQSHPSMAKYHELGLGKVLSTKIRGMLASNPPAMVTMRKMEKEMPTTIFSDDVLRLARETPLTAAHFQRKPTPEATRVIAFTEGWRSPWNDGNGIPSHIHKVCEPLSQIYWTLRSIEDEVRTTDVPEEVLVLKHGSKEHGRNSAVRVRLQVRTPSGTYVPVKKLAELDPNDEIGIIDGPAALAADVLGRFGD